MINAAIYFKEKKIEERSKQFGGLEKEKAETAKDSATGFDVIRDAIIPKSAGERGTFLENIKHIATRSP